MFTFSNNSINQFVKEEIFSLLQRYILTSYEINTDQIRLLLSLQTLFIFNLIYWRTTKELLFSYVDKAYIPISTMKEIV